MLDAKGNSGEIMGWRRVTLLAFTIHLFGFLWKLTMEETMSLEITKIGPYSHTPVCATSRGSVNTNET